MIVVNEAREKHDSYNGPTIRPPERVLRRRRSLSPLPDYEASEALYRRSVALEKKKAWHQSKMWRAALFLLLTYALLTTVIGVPIIVKKLKDDGNDQPWNGSFMGNQQFSSSSSVITYQGNMPCNTWNDMNFVHSSSPYQATLRVQLPATGDISIRSNATLESTQPSKVIGSLTVDHDATIKDNNARLTVVMQTTSTALQDATLVCHTDSGPDRGLSIFFPNNISDMDPITMNIHVTFPRLAPSTSISNFNVYLPVFTQDYKDLDQVDFRSINIEGTYQPIRVTSIQAPSISVKSMLGDISGTYNASESLLLDTIKGAINASITLVKATARSAPTQMTLDTGDRDIDAHVTLVSPGRFSPSPQFVGKVNNFNAGVNFAITHDPSTPPLPIYFTVQNNLGSSKVTLDEKFEGTFLAQTKLSTVAVLEGNENQNYDDIFGSSRQRTLLIDQPTSSLRSSGWIGWGKRPASSVGQSHVEVTSSLGPVEIVFGST